jgi:hypothetical protein
MRLPRLARRFLALSLDDVNEAIDRLLAARLEPLEGDQELATRSSGVVLEPRYQAFRHPEQHDGEQGASQAHRTYEVQEHFSFGQVESHGDALTRHATSQSSLASATCLQSSKPFQAALLTPSPEGGDERGHALLESTLVADLANVIARGFDGLIGGRSGAWPEVVMDVRKPVVHVAHGIVRRRRGSDRSRETISEDRERCPVHDALRAGRTEPLAAHVGRRDRIAALSIGLRTPAAALAMTQGTPPTLNVFMLCHKSTTATL